MLANCVKLVKNSVQKFAKKSWNLKVEKSLAVYKNTSCAFLGRVLQSFNQPKLTWLTIKNNLLINSFTHFPQTSTITTTYINNKDF